MSAMAYQLDIRRYVIWIHETRETYHCEY